MRELYIGASLALRTYLQDQLILFKGTASRDEHTFLVDRERADQDRAAAVPPRASARWAGVSEIGMVQISRSVSLSEASWS